MSCKSDLNKAAKFSNEPKIIISNVFDDSTSIRALGHLNNKYWFAGSKGKYGYVNGSTHKVNKFELIIENDLELRSLAVTENYTYMLTAGNPALIYKISQENERVQLVYTESSEGVFYDSMKFWNDNEGIAMGDPQNGCFSLIKTTDAGKSWHKIDCSQMPENSEGEGAFAASNSNLNIQGENVWFVTGGSNSRVFHSIDRGTNWKVYNTPIISGRQMTGIYAIDFYNEKLGVIIGGDWNNKKSKEKNKAITHDGGKTWQLLSDGSGPGYCSDVIFIPETDGQELLAVGSPGIWYSKNQGRTWIELSKEGYYTVTMINSTEGFLAGRYRISKFKLNR